VSPALPVRGQPLHTRHSKTSTHRAFTPTKTLFETLNTMAHASPRKHASEHILPLHHQPSLKSTEYTESKEEVTELYVLCVPLHKLSRAVQFTVCVLGVMFFYLLYGYTQVRRSLGIFIIAARV